MNLWYNHDVKNIEILAVCKVQDFLRPTLHNDFISTFMEQWQWSSRAIYSPEKFMAMINLRSPCLYVNISRSSSSGRLEQYVQILADLGKTRASADVQQRLLTLVTVLVGQTIHHRDQLQGMPQLFINTTTYTYCKLRNDHGCLLFVLFAHRLFIPRL